MGNSVQTRSFMFWLWIVIGSKFLSLEKKLAKNAIFIYFQIFEKRPWNKKIGPKIHKINIFLPKIYQFSIVFKNLSECNKTNRNTYLAQISAYFGPFLDSLGPLFAILGHFGKMPKTLSWKWPKKPIWPTRNDPLFNFLIFHHCAV